MPARASRRPEKPVAAARQLKIRSAGPIKPSSFSSATRRRRARRARITFARHALHFFAQRLAATAEDRDEPAPNVSRHFAGWNGRRRSLQLSARSAPTRTRWRMQNRRVIGAGCADWSLIPVLPSSFQQTVLWASRFASRKVSQPVSGRTKSFPRIPLVAPSSAGHGRDEAAMPGRSPNADANTSPGE